MLEECVCRCSSTFHPSPIQHRVHTTAHDLIPLLMHSHCHGLCTCTSTLLTRRFAKNGNLSTKVGLTRTLREVHLYSDEFADDFYPACYVLSDEDDRHAFLEHFLRCTAMSVLECRAEWKPPSQIVELAVAVLEEYAMERENGDVDVSLDAERRCSPAECHALVQVRVCTLILLPAQILC